MSAVVDTNIVIRHLTGEPADQTAVATALLASDELLYLTEVTIAECAHVLRSVYRTPHATIAVVLRSLISQRQIRVDHPERLMAALNILETSGLGFPDAHLAATSLELDTPAISFERGLDRVDGLVRREP